MPLLERCLHLFFALLYGPMAWSYDLVADLVSIGRWKHWIGTVHPFIQGMGKQARRRIVRRSCLNPILIRGRAQQLPFQRMTFETVVATFPAEYIFDPQTLIEVHNVLQPMGKFVILPVAWITGRGFVDRIMAWVFEITGQTPAEPVDQVRSKLKQLFEPAGFRVEVHEVALEGSSVLIVLAKKEE